jgi:hypothetical protein
MNFTSNTIPLQLLAWSSTPYLKITPSYSSENRERTYSRNPLPFLHLHNKYCSALLETLIHLPPPLSTTNTVFNITFFLVNKGSISAHRRGTDILKY